MTCLRIVHARHFHPEMEKLCSAFVVDDATGDMWMFSQSGDYVAMGRGKSFRVSTSVPAESKLSPSVVSGDDIIEGDIILDPKGDLYLVSKVTDDGVTVTSLAINLAGPKGDRGYSIHHAENRLGENDTVSVSTITPNDNIQVGDQVIDDEGNLFEIVKYNHVSDGNDTVVIGNLLTSLRGSDGFAVVTYPEDILSDGSGYEFSKTSGGKVKIGDTVTDSRGDVYTVTAIDGITFSVGKVLYSIKGPKGDKGDPFVLEPGNNNDVYATADGNMGWNQINVIGEEL